MKKGYFITFEGPDGSGKTSILKKVLLFLQDNNVQVEATREPGGKNSVCEKIRQLVLNESKNINKYAEALLFSASRAQHFYEYIMPNLEKGLNIISDRFLDSSIAYQGFGRNLGYENIEQINKFSIKDFKPDFTFFFDISPEAASERIFINENREKNRFDLEDLEIQKKVYLGYKEIIKRDSNRIIIIDAKKSFDEVYIQVVNEMKKIFGIKDDK